MPFTQKKIGDIFIKKKYLFLIIHIVWNNFKETKPNRNPETLEKLPYDYGLLIFPSPHSPSQQRLASFTSWNHSSLFCGLILTLSYFFLNLTKEYAVPEKLVSLIFWSNLDVYKIKECSLCFFYLIMGLNWSDETIALVLLSINYLLSAGGALSAAWTVSA